MVSKRVLVVDDDDAGRKLMGEILRDAGFEVDLAENGRVALEQLKDVKPDGVVVDLVMPQMDGFDFLMQMHKLPGAEAVPAVVVSAEPFIANLTVGTLGVRAAVAKPFELDELVEVVTRVLEEQPPG